MRLFGTIYPQPAWPDPASLRPQYVTQLWARGKTHARELMRLRRLKEEPCEWTDRDIERPSWLLYRALSARVKNRPRTVDVCHALVFLGYLAVASRVSTGRQILGDSGWLHAAIHWVDPGIIRPLPAWRPIVDRVITIEEQIPGFLHPTRPHPRYQGRRA